MGFQPSRFNTFFAQFYPVSQKIKHITEEKTSVRSVMSLSHEVGFGFSFAFNNYLALFGVIFSCRKNQCFRLVIIVLNSSKLKILIYTAPGSVKPRVSKTEDIVLAVNILPVKR